MREKVFTGIWRRLQPYAYTLICWLLTRIGDNEYHYADGVVYTTDTDATERELGRFESMMKENVMLALLVPFFYASMATAHFEQPALVLGFGTVAIVTGILWVAIPRGLETPRAEVRA